MQKPYSLLNTCKSVLWALIGVQSDKNRTEDFTQGSAKHFIIIGLFVVVLFIVSLLIIVNFVLS